MATSDSEISKLVEGLSEQLGFRRLRQYLRRASSATAGFNSKAEISETAAQGSASGDIVYNALLSAQRELVLAGTKDLILYNLDDLVATEAANAARDLKVDADNPYASRFPLPLSLSDLKGRDSSHVLAAVIKHPNQDVSLVFCAKRTYDEKNRYRSDEVTEVVRQSFAGFDEFITIKRADYQVFDVVTIRRSLKRLEILIDQPIKLTKPENSIGRSQILLGLICSAVPVLSSVSQSSPTEFFKCIDAIYRNNHEGRVKKLSYLAPTHSDKRESMTSEDDLRIETGHAAAIKALGQITAYSIIVEWEKISPNVPESVQLQISASKMRLGNGVTSANVARISGAQSDAAIQCVANKLTAYST